MLLLNDAMCLLTDLYNNILIQHNGMHHIKLIACQAYSINLDRNIKTMCLLTDLYNNVLIQHNGMDHIKKMLFMLLKLCTVECDDNEGQDLKYYRSWNTLLLSKSFYFHQKVKGKGRLWVLQYCFLEAYCTLIRMSSFIYLQRRCTHQGAWETYASKWRNYTWNIASNP